MFNRVILSFLLICISVSVSAQQASPPSRLPSLSDYEITKALEAHEIANFPLTSLFLDKMEKIQAELIELPIEREEDASGDDLTVAGLTRAIETRPLVMAVLERYQMGVRDYVVGSMALSNALLAVVAETEEEEEGPLLFDERSSVSPENLEFGRQYADRIRALYGG